MTRFEGKFYASGRTPLEIRSRWEYCEPVAQHPAKKSVDCKAGKRSQMDVRPIIDRYFQRLVKTGWVLEPEAACEMRRCAQEPNWPLPDSLRQCDGLQTDDGTV